MNPLRFDGSLQLPLRMNGARGTQVIPGSQPTFVITRQLDLKCLQIGN
jgi:hypothetical protein